MSVRILFVKTGDDKVVGAFGQRSQAALGCWLDRGGSGGRWFGGSVVQWGGRTGTVCEQNSGGV